MQNGNVGGAGAREMEENEDRLFGVVYSDEEEDRRATYELDDDGETEGGEDDDVASSDLESFVEEGSEEVESDEEFVPSEGDAEEEEDSTHYDVVRENAVGSAEGEDDDDEEEDEEGEEEEEEEQGAVGRKVAGKLTYLDKKNIIRGRARRTRIPTRRYHDKNFAAHLFRDIPTEDVDALLQEQESDSDDDAHRAYKECIKDARRKPVQIRDLMASLPQKPKSQPNDEEEEEEAEDEVEEYETTSTTPLVKGGGSLCDIFLPQKPAVPPPSSTANDNTRKRKAGTLDDLFANSTREGK